MPSLHFLKTIRVFFQPKFVMILWLFYDLIFKTIDRIVK